MKTTTRWILGGAVALAVAGAAYVLPAVAAENPSVFGFGRMAAMHGSMTSGNMSAMHGSMMSGNMAAMHGSMTSGNMAAMHGSMMSGDMAAMHSQMAPLMAQMGAVHDTVMGEVAALLGLNRAELEQALGSGKSLSALAAEKQVAIGDLQAVMTKGMKSFLDAQVQAGTITQEQAAQMLAMHAQNAGTCAAGGSMMGGNRTGY